MTSIHSIWYPLYDNPILIRMSREQLQAIQDALLGRPETPEGWGAWFARTEIERLLVESLGEEDDGQNDEESQQ